MVKSLQELFERIEKKKRLFWIITLVYISFNGCFMFPFNRMVENLMDPFLLTVLGAYIIIGLLFVGLCKKSHFKVFILTLIFTVLGMVLRYILEFGEVSNTLNFTTNNVLITVLVVPLFVTLVYWISQNRRKL